jgi:predicted MFS family arabinose efflux permease
LSVAYLRRGLPETKRWTELSASLDYRRGLSELGGPELRARFVVLNTIAACAAVSASPAFAFASFHATRAFQWSPAEVSAMIIAGGAIGMSGWFVFGKAADVTGRRTSGAVAMALGGVAAAAFYQSAWLIPAFAALVFMEAGVAIALNALGTELFPTHLRATAKSWITNAGILGAMAGLAIVGLLSERIGGAATVISLLAIVPIVATPLLFVVRETRGEELETTSG